jgi:hypothetical protein
VLFEGRIVNSGDKQVALVLEQKGYRWIEEQVKGSEPVRSWGGEVRAMTEATTDSYLANFAPFERDVSTKGPA